jgi:transketolase
MYDLIKMNNDLLSLKSNDIRKTILNMIYQAKASHISSALSLVDIITFLYFSENWKFYKKNIKDRDSVILSKGHACTVLYSALYHSGVLKKSDIGSYGKNGSSMMHHISHKVPGVDFSTGSLGHGLPYTTGLALSDLINQTQHNKRFCILGDGELAEGSNWEAMLFAAHNKLNNIITIIDNNNLQSLGTVKETMNLDSIIEKFDAFGWDVVEVDGHNFFEIKLAIEKASNGLPKAIIAKTIKGKGISFMENKVEWHYKNPNKDEFLAAMAELEGA